MAAMGVVIVYSIGLFLRASGLDSSGSWPSAMTIEGLLPVKAAVSSVSVGAVQTTFFLFVAIFTLFLVIETRIIIKAIKQGPKIEEQKGE